jgi:hypothetical protein
MPVPVTLHLDLATNFNGHSTSESGQKFTWKEKLTLINVPTPNGA